MATKRPGKKKASAKTKTKSTSTKKAASSQRIAKLVTKAIEGIESRLNDESDPLGIGDYIKVMQLQKEIQEEQPKEITVTWVDPAPKREK
jgi:hypothetical protein